MIRNTLANVRLASLTMLIASAAITASAQTIATPSVPANIAVPAGNAAYLKGFATGTQNYICMTTNSGLQWKFLGPQATLFATFRWLTGDIRQQVTTHYLSPSLPEPGTPARATWQSSLDTSAVWAKKIAESSDPNYVAQGAIPWFLLEATGTQRGPTGGSILADTTYLQRVNTTGGAMPATACTEAGVVEYVPYTADYIFYRAKQK